MAEKEDNEKAKLYRRIVQANEHLVLGRMRVHGFWPLNQPIPPDPIHEATERKELAQEIAQLESAHTALQDPAKALAAERKRRMEESKKRRAEQKVQREAAQKQRQEAWRIRKASTVTYLGSGVSGGLEHTQSDTAKLLALRLPHLNTGVELAQAMNISLHELRWLTFHRHGATLVHYHRYGIPKKSGGVRNISAPKPKLKTAQYWVFDKILKLLDSEPQAHGFVPKRSMLTNAQPHVGRQVVINLDVKDFFPSISFRRVKGLFASLGYSAQVATILALLCTEPPRVAAELDGRTYHVAMGERFLPQGACTSPAITNVLCRTLDRRIVGLAQKHRFVYTRYADDLTFSGDDLRVVGRLIRSVESILLDEGLILNAEKTRVMRRSSHQEVTGVTVNDRPSVSRTEVRTLRAILHNAAKHGLESQNRQKVPNFAAHLMGRIAFVCMIDPQRGMPLRTKLYELKIAE